VPGRLRGCDPGAVVVDMPVTVGFEPGPGGQAIPSFIAATADAVVGAVGAVGGVGTGGSP
jgi:uncharacterized protein